MLNLARDLDVLISAEAIAARCAELGAQLTKDLAGHDVVLVAVLKGSFLFLADLARCIDLPVTVDFLGLSSYGDNTETTGVVRITSDLSKPVLNKDVVIVEDIVDSGLTMKFLLENLATRHPASVRICTLLHKPARTRVQIPLDYVGFTIEDRFVAGYGLDYQERYRNVPFVGVMRRP
jgi:hypoxanthine phosphoribosyltransferase